MAANKFATLLHRKTNKITLILIYAVLEWILIVLLLLNSLFSYLIIKFAEFFGLKPPCLWCTRLDHIFDPATKERRNMHRDLLCEAHAKEVSNLGYCWNHRKLVESQFMCEDCLSSRPEFDGFPKNFPWVKEKVGENGVLSLNCSCCGLSLLLDNNNSIYSSYILLKTSSWDASDKENLIAEDGDYYDNLIQEDKKISDLFDKNDNQMLSENIDESLEVTEKETKDSGFVDQLKEFEDGKVVVENGILKDEISSLMLQDKAVQVCAEQDMAIAISPQQQHLEFFLDYSGHRLVPIELVDSMTEECKSKDDNVMIEDGGLKNNDQEFSLDFEIGMEEREEGWVVENVSSRLEEQADMLVDVDINQEPLDSLEMEQDENSLVFENHLDAEEFEQFTVFRVTQFPSPNDVEELTGKEHSDAHSAYEESAQVGNSENEADVSIGTEIPDLDIITYEIQNQECSPSTSYETSDPCPEEQMVELQPLSVEDRELSNDIEEDKLPETPTSVDSLNQLHKKFMLLEKRDSGAEESLDGSVTSELEGGDGVVTVDRLKSALRAERKALQALYAELEEERSASAEAASQTMAMINRLQEEKAAMQMEALQYQRMMEEQSEYDQEALQLLNELMIKREKEKQELEKELEIYRKKLLDYEMREKIRVIRKSKDGSARSGFSSASCSNGEDSDDLSIDDLNQEVKEEEGFYGISQGNSIHNTPIDAVHVNLEESLDDFEEERLLILEQLKALEEKLMSLDDEYEDEQHFEDVRPMENGTHVQHLNGEANGHANGFSNGKHHKQRRIAGQNGKSLLPLFDAIRDENGDVELHGNGNNGNVLNDSKFETEKKKLALEEEVDHLYERLQALEADREFLKHCIGSLNKGDKGMDLLQEILQHLRDLRNVELRARSLSTDSPIISSA